MDGSVTDVPDSDKNAAFFGRPSNQSRDGAFPQARWVAAAESGTGSLLGAAIGRYTGAGQPLAADLLGCFGPGMVVLADRKTVTGHRKTGMGEGQPVLRSGDPEGVMQEMRALFAVYQAISRLTGIAADAASPRTRSASRTPWPPRPPP